MEKQEKKYYFFHTSKGGTLYKCEKVTFLFFIYFINCKAWKNRKKSITFFPMFKGGTIDSHEKKYFFSWQSTFFHGNNYFFSWLYFFFNKVKKKEKNYVLTDKKVLFSLDKLSNNYCPRFALAIKHLEFVSGKKLHFFTG